MSTTEIRVDDTLAGTARLPVVIAVSLSSFFFSSILEYSLPLYFNALEGFPKGMWASLVLWQVTPWVFTPALAGVLARWYGERRVWAAALVGQAIVPALLVAAPHPWIVPPAAFWNGFTGALMWVGGVSLVQVVPPHRRGLANGLMMMSLGVGSLIGPLAGRSILWGEQVGVMAAGGDWRGVGAFLVNLTKPDADPPLENFRRILLGLAGVALCGAALMWMYGQRPGQFGGAATQQSRTETVADLRRLLTNSRFWALVIALCLLGGPVFQATNQYLRYRAEDLGLISGSQDRGWIVLQLLRTLMWVPGGLAVGLLAGRRAPGLAAVAMLASFALAGAGIGRASGQAALFGAVAVFEFVRQFMRWSHAGYLSEHMPDDLRATAIGCSITVSGLGSTIFGFVADSLMDPDAAGFDSTRPFALAAGLGLTGALGLLIFDRFRPIRQRFTIGAP